jgi:hypothetical protein
MKKFPPLVLLFVLAACSLPTVTPTPLPSPTVSWTVFPTAASTASFTPTADVVPSPIAMMPSFVPSPPLAAGLVVRGRVTLDGVGLAGVSILRQYSAYPGEVVAVTDANGYYQSGFMGIPGDEMVSISAQFAGYMFDPPYIYWRHYFGYEETTCNFTAQLTP